MAETLHVKSTEKAWSRDLSTQVIVLYLLVAIVHWLAIGKGGWMHQVSVVTRGMHMPILIFWVLTWDIPKRYEKSSLQKSKIKIILLSALFASWIGDMLVSYDAQDEFYFMLGLCFFLFTHLLMAWSFGITRNGFSTLKQAKKKWLPIACIALAIATIYTLAYPKLGEEKIPVLIYALVFLIQIILTIDRKGRVSKSSYLLVLMGSLAFLISDSLLAVNKFIEPIVLGEYVTSSTYLLAQLLIVGGLKIHTEKT